MTKPSIYFVLVAGTIISAVTNAAAVTPDAPARLRTEHLTAPLGVNTTYPLMKQWMGYVDANTKDGLL